MFIARLFGFVVLAVFVGAMLMSAMSSFDFGSFVASKEVGVVEETKKQEPNLVLDNNSFDVPESFESEGAKANLSEVKVGSLDELKEMIYKEGSVVVFLDNKILKNPFVDKDGVFKVILNGFSKTHLFSNGDEVGQDSFVYANDDFMAAFRESGSLVWIFN